MGEDLGVFSRHLTLHRILFALAVILPAMAANTAASQPTIVILSDPGFADEAHVNALRALGSVAIYAKTTTEAEAITQLRGATVAIVDTYSVPPLGETVLKRARMLKLLVIRSTGYERVDVELARRRGILVANLPAYSTEAVAEQAFALMLAVSRRIRAGAASVRRGLFEVNEADPAQGNYRGFELSGKTLGIVGLGSIGTRVAEIARGFGMTTVAWNRSKKNVPGVEQVTLEQLLVRSDIVSLHLALNAETNGLLSAERLGLMKPAAILINTARGQLVDETALYEALRAHRLGGAGLDTIVDMTSSNPLLRLDNVVFSPHTGYFTVEANNNRADVIVATVKAYLAGAPINIVN
jgi:phosphoglycerate dehydrogenase-like enzyme